MEHIYTDALQAWSRMESFRSERTRCKRYVYGDQWSETISVGDNRMSEESFIRQHGQIPLKNNILRRILRNVVGLYRAQYKVPQLSARDSALKGESLRSSNKKRREWFQQNRMEELSPRLLEEFLISGIVAVKVEDSRILSVTPDNFFFHSDGYDPRGKDVDLVGEVHKVTFSTLLEKFCDSADDYRRVAAIYNSSAGGGGYCRIVEVWYKEIEVLGLLHDVEGATLKVGKMSDIISSMMNSAKGSLGKVKGVVKRRWRRLWFAENGELLRDTEVCDSHPYVFKAYPFLDGEIHSYIGDLIDQQRYVNRLITLYDFVMKSSAKGVLLFPDECIPAGMDLQDVANEWSRFNGVIPYRARPGVPMPTQVSGNAANIGITELLKIQMQMLEDISGVSPTLQGKLVANSTSGTLFAQQNEAAQTSLLDILRTFDDFLSTLVAYTPQ
ncbi:MAG: hypothetical protein K2N35_17445 [Muribaculaceae bacterium]|nr:hypothetical protein [Muribaculaceae bacterium]